MGYFAPYIDTTGLHIPSYNDVLGECLTRMRTIFGSDIYLSEDSQDYQQVAIFAKCIHDICGLASLVYNNKTPTTAIGTGLDLIGAFVDIKRKQATHSTVILTCTGTPGTDISGGEVMDTAGNTWVIPDGVQIQSGGMVEVTASCAISGRVTIAANTATIIATPVYGWSSVTNTVSSSPGVEMESDFSLRGRYSMATMLPSRSIFEGMYSALQTLEGVTRVRGYENDTGATTDGSVEGIPAGLPPHSVCFIVEGGDDNAIASSIYTKKTPGCNTFGTTSVELRTRSGNTFYINFFRPKIASLKLRVTIRKLPAYSDYFLDRIREGLSEYIETRNIAEVIYNNVLLSVVVMAMEEKGNPPFAVQTVEVSTNGGSTYTTADYVPDYYEVTSLAASDVEIEVV